MVAPLSILDLATIGPGETARDALEGSTVLAQQAERLGFGRIWYAEHHNNSAIASSATSVLIAHVAAHTRFIRLGAGGVMLPNHAPLTIAEQFGTLETLHPGRIDLGLGRAPGTDRPTLLALRRHMAAADTFPQDVQELQGYLRGPTCIAGVEATPGKGTNVPLYLLGSSLYGAGMAAALGLPYAFASHFSPDALEEAVALYRRQFQPSEQLGRPYVIAGVNALAADTELEAAHQLQVAKRRRVGRLFGAGRHYSDEEADSIIASPRGAHLLQMLTYTAVGTAAQARDYLERFRRHADADELIVAPLSPTVEDRLRSVELLSELNESMAA